MRLIIKYLFGKRKDEELSSACKVRAFPHGYNKKALTNIKRIILPSRTKATIWLRGND